MRGCKPNNSFQRTRYARRQIQALDGMRKPSKLHVASFLGFCSIHAGLYGALAFLPTALAVPVLFTSWLPWLLLSRLPLAVSTQGLIPFPNTPGYACCVIGWVACYWFLGGLVARGLSNYSSERARVPRAA